MSNRIIAAIRDENVALLECDQTPCPGERWSGANCVVPGLSLTVPPAWNVNSERNGGPRARSGVQIIDRLPDLLLLIGLGGE